MKVSSYDVRAKYNRLRLKVVDVSAGGRAQEERMGIGANIKDMYIKAH